MGCQGTCLRATNNGKIGKSEYNKGVSQGMPLIAYLFTICGKYGGVDYENDIKREKLETI